MNAVSGLGDWEHRSKAGTGEGVGTRAQISVDLDALCGSRHRPYKSGAAQQITRQPWFRLYISNAVAVSPRPYGFLGFLLQFGGKGDLPTPPTSAVRLQFYGRVQKYRHG